MSDRLIRPPVKPYAAHAKTVSESLWRKYAYSKNINQGGDRARQVAL